MKYRVACVYFSPPRDLTSFAEACLRFSPEIAVRPEEAVFLEIGKCRSLYSEETFLKRMRVMLQRYGEEYVKTAKIAIADDATQALIQAKYGAAETLPFASLHDFADPFLLAPDDKKRKPLETMIHSLQLLGLRTVADFVRLPPAELAARFGAIALHARSQIEDSKNVAWPRWTPRELIEETVELAHDDYCNWLEPLLFHVKTALDRVYARLQGRALRCASLHLELKLEKDSTVRRPIRTFDFEFMMPQGTVRGTLPILRERLEREFATVPLESAVLRVRTVVRETTPGYQRQQHLYDKRDDIEEAFHSIVSHLAESVGPSRVFRAVVCESRLPEKSWKKREHDQEVHADVATQLASRPSRLLSLPKKIEIAGDRILLREKRGQKTYTIQSWSEAERIQANWLDSPTFEAISRHYFQVEIAEGPALWIYRDEKQQFYLQGWYE